MPNPIPVTFSTTNLGSNCYASEQLRFEAYINHLIGNVPSGYVQVIESSTKPAPQDQDKIWLKTNPSTGLGEGFFIFVNGSWSSTQPHPIMPGVIVDLVLSDLNGLSFADAVAYVLTLDGGTSLAPFWRVCDGTNGTPDLRGRSTLSAGKGADISGTAMTTRVYGTLFGEETISLISNQIPNIFINHVHGIGFKSTITGYANVITGAWTADKAYDTLRYGSDGGGLVEALTPNGTVYNAPATLGTPAAPYGLITGSGFATTTPVAVAPGYPHDNMQPDYVTYKIQRTALKYLIIP